jgi:hypothetical protein
MEKPKVERTPEQERYGRLSAEIELSKQLGGEK